VLHNKVLFAFACVFIQLISIYVCFI